MSTRDEGDLRHWGMAHAVHARHRTRDLACRQTSNIKRTLVGNKIVDHSDVVGASPVGAAPTMSSFPTKHMASMAWAETIVRWDEKHLSFGIWCDLYDRFDSIYVTNADVARDSGTMTARAMASCGGVTWLSV